MRSRVASVLNTPRWFANPAYADLAVVADFNADRYALPALGPEKVVNGGFDADISWTKGSGTTIAGGVATTTGISNFAAMLTGSMSLTVGALYEVQFTVNRTSGTIALGIDTTTVLATGFAGGTFKGYYTPTVATPSINIFESSGSTFVGSIDNVSVREVKLDGSKRLATFDEVFAFSASSAGARTLIDSAGKLTTPPNNLITGSEDLFGWSNNNAAPALNVATAADGTQTAHRLTTVASDGQILSPTLAINGYFIMAVEVKADTKNAAMLVAFDSGNFITPQFSLDTGALIDNTVSGSTFSDVSTGSINLGGGWWKVWTRAKATSTNIGFWLRAPGSTGSILFRHLQFEAVTYETTPRPYYPTTSSPYTSSRRMTYANGKRQLRLENTGTNLAIWSTDMAVFGGGGAWNSDSAPGYTAYNRGTVDCYAEIQGSSGEHYPRVAWTLDAGVTYTISAEFQKIPGVPVINNLRMAIYNGVGWVNGPLFQDELTETTWVRKTLTVTQTSSSGEGAGWHHGFGAENAGYRVRRVNLEVGAFASDHIPTSGTAVTRAIETARLSPLVEAILQRTAASIVVRAQNMPGDSGNRVVGLNTQTNSPDLIGREASDTIASTWDGANVNSATAGSGSFLTAWGVGMGFDATGRGICFNGGAVSSNAFQPAPRTQVYLGRQEALGASNGNYAAAYYDALLIAPTRLSNTRLQALAVAA